jgi:hypothetical protein
VISIREANGRVVAVAVGRRRLGKGRRLIFVDFYIGDTSERAFLHGGGDMLAFRRRAGEYLHIPFSVRSNHMLLLVLRLGVRHELAEVEFGA